jgi:CDP-diacylglycerol--serine O-phosphatidyltransferase
MAITSYIPSALTLLNLCCGVLSIILLDIFWSPILLIVAAIFDLFDGAAARWLDAESEFGKELDSLCDMVSFGVAPAVLYWLLLPTEAYWLMIAPLAIPVFAAIRLARFNLTPSSTEFEGIPSPAMAMFFVGLILAVYWEQPFFTSLVSQEVPYLLVGVGISAGMIRKVPMFSLKGYRDPEVRKWLIILAVLSVMILIFDYRMALPSAFLMYFILSGIRQALKEGVKW